MVFFFCSEYGLQWPYWLKETVVSEGIVNSLLDYSREEYCTILLEDREQHVFISVTPFSRLRKGKVQLQEERIIIISRKKAFPTPTKLLLRGSRKFPSKNYQRYYYLLP